MHVVAAPSRPAGAIGLRVLRDGSSPARPPIALRPSLVLTDILGILVGLLVR